MLMLRDAPDEVAMASRLGGLDPCTTTTSPPMTPCAKALPPGRMVANAIALVIVSVRKNDVSLVCANIVPDAPRWIFLDDRCVLSWGTCGPCASSRIACSTMIVLSDIVYDPTISDLSIGLSPNARSRRFQP